jgi:hypothetical protein
MFSFKQASCVETIKQAVKHATEFFSFCGVFEQIVFFKIDCVQLSHSFKGISHRLTQNLGCKVNFHT